MDNRIFERIDGSFNVKYSRLLPEDSKEFVADSKNLSGGGIRILLNERFNKGDIIRIKISAPSIPKVEARCFGRIAWIWEADNKPYDAGIEFINQDLLQVGRLYSYLEGQKKIGI